MKWFSNVMLIDTETSNQIGECWVVEVNAAGKAEASAKIRAMAWEDVDSRLNDVRIELLDGPIEVDGDEEAAS